MTHPSPTIAQGKSAVIAQADALSIPLADASVDLVFTSPPYVDARTYGIGAQRGCVEWIDWMLSVVKECCRVCTGLVLVNCAGVTRDHRYWPAPEGLLWRWWKQGGECWRSAFLHRVGIPGSGGKQWLRSDVEFILAFKGRPGAIPWADNTACGHEPKYGSGGNPSHRRIDGTRVGDANRDAFGFGGRRVRTRPGYDDCEMAGKPMYRRGKNGERPTKAAASGERVQAYVPPAKANPGNLIKTIVGGGVMGSKLAHENEAPFSESVAEFFVKSFSRPGGIVLDPFSGSGTTIVVARRLGRIGIGLDIRMNQCELALRRLAEPPRGEAKRRSQIVPNDPSQRTLFELSS
jgi:hypothetical protein